MTMAIKTCTVTNAKKAAAKATNDSGWRTTEDGAKIFINGGNVHAGGPNGPILGGKGEQGKVAVSPKTKHEETISKLKGEKATLQSKPKDLGLVSSSSGKDATKFLDSMKGMDFDSDSIELMFDSVHSTGKGTLVDWFKENEPKHAKLAEKISIKRDKEAAKYKQEKILAMEKEAKASYDKEGKEKQSLLKRLKAGKPKGTAEGTRFKADPKGFVKDV